MLRSNTLRLLAFAGLLASHGGCQLLAPDEENQLTLHVAPNTAECMGVGPQRCLLVKEHEDQAWTHFHGGIEGFTFEPGYRYTLLVEWRRVPDPPADGLRTGASPRHHGQRSTGRMNTELLQRLRKEFGANNFYGGNAPSREWTNQALLSADHRLGAAGGWAFDAVASYRTHGDRFLFNQERPEVSDNRHRTHAALASVRATTAVGGGASLTAGAEAGDEGGRPRWAGRIERGGGHTRPGGRATYPFRRTARCRSSLPPITTTR